MSEGGVRELCACEGCEGGKDREGGQGGQGGEGREVVRVTAREGARQVSQMHLSRTEGSCMRE